MSFSMSFFRTLSAMGLTLAVFSTANAATFIEPSIGYRSHNLKLTSITTATTEVKMATPVYGLKIGYSSPLGIDLNLSYDYSSGKAEISPSMEKNDFSQSTASAQLGVSALGALKIYLGYGFLNELKIKEGLTTSDMNLKGQSYQAGLQFKIFSRVMLGLQYNINQYKTVSGRDFILGEKVDTYFNKVDSQDYSLNLSTSF